MSYNIDNIVSVNVSLSQTGLQVGNFGSVTVFADKVDGELPADFLVDTYRVYSSISELSKDFSSDKETYKSGAKLLGAIPKQKQINVWATNKVDATITVTLNKARDKFWWFYTVFTKDVYADIPSVLIIAEWCNENRSFFINNQTGVNTAAIRDVTVVDDVATQLTAKGYKFSDTFAHASDAYAGNALITWFSNVNYSVTNSTITGEYKRLSGVVAEDLTSTENTAMKNKNVTSYQIVELDGQKDNGRVINTVTHSGEYLDAVIDLEAFVNDIQVGVYNVITSSPTKLPQTPSGQHAVIAAADSVGDQFIENGYLGTREYIDSSTGETKVSSGYEMITKPEDIYTISDDDRAKRLCAPIIMDAYPSGAIQGATININVKE